MGLTSVHLFPALLLLVAVHTTYSYYTAMVPSSVQPGLDCIVPVRVSNSINGQQVAVTGEIVTSADQVLGTHQITINDGDTGVLKIRVDSSVQGPIRFKIRGSQGLTFENETSVKLEGVARLNLIQSDKAIYKANDGVMFRVLAVDRELKPIKEKKTIRVKNPSGSAMQKYVDEGHNVVFEGVFVVFDAPELGDWKIEVEYEDGSKEERSFKVDEYVPPKFEVQAGAKKGFIVSGKEEEVTVHVEAKYTYGKKVKGTVFMSSGGKKLELENKEIDGSGEFRVNLKKQIEDAKKKYKDSLNIEVNVMDETEATASTSVNVLLSSIPVKMEFDKSLSDLVYRENMTARFVVKVTDPVGGPLPDEYQGETLTLTLRDNSNRQKSLRLRDGNGGDYTFVFENVQAASDWLNVDAKLEISRGLMSGNWAANLNLEKYKTFGEAQLNAKWIDKSTEMWGTAVFAVELHKPEKFDSSSFWYMIISRGTIMEDVTKVENTDRVTVDIRPEMCPEAEIIVFGTTSPASATPEILADRLKLKLSGCSNKEVKTRPQPSELKTGEEATVNVDVSWTMRNKPEPVGTHHVYLLAVDKSMNLLVKQNNDISQDRVEGALGEYKMAPIEGSVRRRKRSVFPGPAPGSPITSTGALLKDVGVKVLADADMKDEEEQIFFDGPVMMMEAAGGAVPQNNEMMEKDTDMADGSEADVRPGAEDSSTEVVRTDFPDTWIWEMGTTNNEGHFDMKRTVPDSITSWVISAFAIAEQEGEEIAVTSDPAELRVYNPFFVTMNLPYSIRRKEIFTLRCTVFNYEDVDRNTEVTLMGSDDFEVQGQSAKSVKVKANEADSVEFKIKATKVAIIDLSVTAKGTAVRNWSPQQYTDTVVKPLIVEPEGEKHTMAVTLPVIIGDNENVKEERVQLDFPENTVEDSRRMWAKVTGDMMGNALNNIEDLVSQPFGCGEQNMITVVPNIAAMNYLTAVNDDSAEFREKALNYMTKGYHREQNYRWDDGGFSAFGKSDQEPSTWLTAFVLRSFAQAIDFIPNAVDKDALAETVNWLWSLEIINRGKFDGFRRKGRVIHDEMQGGTGAGDAFDVYVVMCLMEAQLAGIPSDHQAKLDGAYDWVKSMATNLVATQPDKKKRFFAAIMAYTLTLWAPVDESLVKSLLTYVDDSSPPWKEVEDDNKEEEDRPQPMPYYRRRPLGPSDVEITSYSILAYVNLSSISDAHPLVIWLQKQQNEKGGFSSTQNTMMALQAISAFAAQMASSADSKVKLIFTDGGTMEIDVTSNNRRILQIEELPRDITELTVRVEGQGSTTLVKIVWTYHTKPDGEERILRLTSRGVLIRPKLIEYTNCMEVDKDNEVNTKGMYVMSMRAPTGISPENIVETKKDNRHAKRVEMDKNKNELHFYTEEPFEKTCFKIRMAQEFDVEGAQNGTLWAYSYYNSDQIYNSVEVIALGDDGTCELCPTGHAAPLTSTSRLLLTAGICLLVSLVLAL